MTVYICLYILIPCIITYIFFFFNDTATTEIYTLSLHDALPISERWHGPTDGVRGWCVMRISVLVLLAVGGATPGLAQTPSHGSGGGAGRELRTAPPARLTRRRAPVAAIAAALARGSEPHDSVRPDPK